MIFCTFLSYFRRFDLYQFSQTPTFPCHSFILLRAQQYKYFRVDQMAKTNKLSSFPITLLNGEHMFFLFRIVLHIHYFERKYSIANTENDFVSIKSRSRFEHKLSSIIHHETDLTTASAQSNVNCLIPSVNPSTCAQPVSYVCNDTMHSAGWSSIHFVVVYPVISNLCSHCSYCCFCCCKVVL